jgi:hypothetical protein
VAGAVASRLQAIDVSDLGVVVPKAIRIEREHDGGIVVTTLGAGTDRGLRLAWAHDPGDEPAFTTFVAPPGASALAPAGGGALAMASPLLDAWAIVVDVSPTVVKVDDAGAPARNDDARLGEALLFTTQMAPWNRSEGRLSRFTCETCHFEGYVDGRTHHTGRGDVHATTKPLLGLFNNRPHFSRALDQDLTSVADNEFRVAGAKSDRDPWFSIETHDFPWLAQLGIRRETLSPIDLRRAFMAFLMDFAHRPNPLVSVPRAGARWTGEERAGAEVFRDRCESCHEARLVADEPARRVPFDGWESLVMTREDPLVWARAEYAKTGVVPYVNDSGARVVSLRRLYKKYPYFTNGSAKDLASVLERVRFGPGGVFYHDGAPEDAALQALDARERSVLLRFLDLL